MWAEAARATGITRMDDGKKGKPHMLGTVNGVQVLVDVYMQEHVHTRPDSTSRRKMPWTRVIAQLSSSLDVDVHPKGNTFGQKSEWPQQPSGNPELDARYQLRAPPESNLDSALPEIVRIELLAADPRVHIINNTVLWAQVRNVKDAGLLIRPSRPPPALPPPLIKAKPYICQMPFQMERSEVRNLGIQIGLRPNREDFSACRVEMMQTTGALL